MSRKMMPSWIPGLLLSCLGLGLSGCQQLFMQIEEQKIDFCYRRAASSAWRAHRENYTGTTKFPTDFGRGFRAGYHEILQGGKGCVPTLPPTCYWGPRYLDDMGRARIVAWFDGWSHGVAAAKCDGAEGRGKILSSISIYRRTPGVVMSSDEGFSDPATLSPIMSLDRENGIPMSPPKASPDGADSGNPPVPLLEGFAP